MRIVLTSLDGIGDVMLRQPLFAALAEAGHELLIVSRHFTAPLTKQIVPRATVLALAPDPYKMTQARDAHFPEEVLAAIQAFYPELLVVAPFQWTIFEDYLASKLPHVETLAMSGYAYEADARPVDDPLPAFTPHRRVETPEETPELQKNELLCQAVLGRTLALGRPVLQATVKQIRRAEELLVRQGISPGTFWICCVGHSEDYYSRLRSWSRDEWITVLGQIAGNHGSPLVLVGSHEDRDSLMWIRDRLSGAGVPMAVATDRWGELDLLIGLAAAARGYIGHDTGPMHLAAALGRPVIGVFGGGTWPRFLPAVEPSRVISVKVPCQGCGWFCHMEESFCIKKIPVDEVVCAVDDLVGGKITGREVKTVDPGPKMLADMVRRGVAVERRKRYMLREHYQTATQAMRDSQARLAELMAAKNTLAQREMLLGTLHQQHGDLTARHEQEAAELAAAKTILAQREAYLAQLKDQHNELAAQRERDIAGLCVAQTQIGELQGEITMLSETRGTLEQQIAQLAAHSEQDAQRLDQANLRIAQLRREVAALTEAIAARALDSEMQQKKLKQQLAILQADLRDAQYARSQLTGTLARVEQEHRTMLEGLRQLTLKNQQLQSEMQTLHGQLEKTLRERDEQALHARELSLARSRRWLLKWNLVSRCPWETEG